MKDEEWWGLILLVYIIPFGLWQILSNETLNIKEKLYPGKSEKELMGINIQRLSLAWIGGFVLLLLLWSANIPAIAGLIILAITFGLLFLIYKLIVVVRNKKFLSNSLVRTWISSTTTWFAGVGAYYLIFESTSRIDEKGFIFLAILPPLVLAIGMASWIWAKNTK